MSDVKFNKALIAFNSLIPLAMLGVDWYRGALGANPIEFFLRATGVLTLIFVLITLAVTPLRRIFSWNGLIKYRRMLGLFAFFYASLHLVTYSLFDKGLDIGAITGDVLQRPFIAVGMAAFLMLVPLAVTSTNGWVKRLGGKRWAKLHRLTYVIAVLGVVHFWMIVKSDIFYPAIFGTAVAVLLGMRIYWRFRPGRARATPVPSTPLQQ